MRKILPLPLILLTTLTLVAHGASEPIEEQTGETAAVIGPVVAFLKAHRATEREENLESIARNVYFHSRCYDIDYRLVLAVMKVESNFRQDAVSRKGALGLLQVKPSLAKSYADQVGVKWEGKKTLRDSAKNILFGVHHLSQLISAFGHLPRALRAYNEGAARVKEGRKSGSGSSFSKTVMSEYRKNLEILPDP